MLLLLPLPCLTDIAIHTRAGEYRSRTACANTASISPVAMMYSCASSGGVMTLTPTLVRFQTHIPAHAACNAPSSCKEN